MKKAFIILVSIAIMVFGSVSLFGYGVVIMDTMLDTIIKDMKADIITKDLTDTTDVIIITTHMLNNKTNKK